MMYEYPVYELRAIAKGGFLDADTDVGRRGAETSVVCGGEGGEVFEGVKTPEQCYVAS